MSKPKSNYLLTSKEFIPRIGPKFRNLLTTEEMDCRVSHVDYERLFPEAGGTIGDGRDLKARD
jgi:hypothetical protein